MFESVCYIVFVRVCLLECLFRVCLSSVVDSHVFAICLFVYECSNMSVRMCLLEWVCWIVFVRVCLIDCIDYNMFVRMCLLQCGCSRMCVRVFVNLRLLACGVPSECDTP